MDSQRAHDWKRWHRAAADPQIDRFLENLYAQVERAITERSPRCDQSGRCCHFETFGHRLYVTGLEIARFLAHAQPPTQPEADDPLRILSDPAPSCIYQVDGLCSTHLIRPLGCRIFFCEPGTENWQQDLYEQFQSQLKNEHERLGLPYAYMEWRAGLAEAAESIADSSSDG